MGEQEAHDRSLHAKYKIKECTDLIKYDMLQNLYREVNVLFYFITVFLFFFYVRKAFSSSSDSGQIFTLFLRFCGVTQWKEPLKCWAAGWLEKTRSFFFANCRFVFRALRIVCDLLSFRDVFCPFQQQRNRFILIAACQSFGNNGTSVFVPLGANFGIELKINVFCCRHSRIVAKCA